MILLFVLVVGFAEEQPPPNIARLFAASEQEKQRLIAETTQLLRKTTGSQRTRLRLALDRFKSTDVVVAPEFVSPLSKGKIGVFGGRFAKVRQIIGPEEMLCEGWFTTPEGVAEVLLIVRGVGTGLLSDGVEAKLPQIFEITNTYTYRTAIGGSKTVMVFEPFDDTLVEEWRVKRAKGKKK